jgi:hypothetical protein
MSKIRIDLAERERRSEQRKAGARAGEEWARSASPEAIERLRRSYEAGEWRYPLIEDRRDLSEYLRQLTGLSAVGIQAEKRFIQAFIKGALGLIAKPEQLPDVFADVRDLADRIYRTRDSNERSLLIEDFTELAEVLHEKGAERMELYEASAPEEFEDVDLAEIITAIFDDSDLEET